MSRDGERESNSMQLEIKIGRHSLRGTRRRGDI